jgi:hypothetical protein
MQRTGARSILTEHRPTKVRRAQSQEHAAVTACRSCRDFVCSQRAVLSVTDVARL